MSEHDQMQPSTDDVLQVEAPAMPLTPIPVVVEGPVRTQDPPDMSLQVGQFFLDSTAGFIQPQRVLGDDPFRARARIVAKDQAIRVGTSQKQVMNPTTCAIWPVGVALEVRARSELWLAADTATTVVSIITEKWQD